VAALNRLYGVGDGDGEAFSFLVVAEVSAFLVVSVDAFSFLVVSVVDDFLVVSVDVFFVEDFFIVFVEAGDFSGAVVVVDVSVLLVQEAMSPAANMTVME
jgi:hypothetical protein